MVEKKVILCAILAIALGIATIVPLEYLMAAQAQENNPNPWSNLAIPYAYWNFNSSNSNFTTLSLDQDRNILTNITLHQNALGDNDARIDYYQLQVYSDQGQICNLTYYIGIANVKLADNYGEIDYLGILHGTFFFWDGSGYQLYGNNSSGGTFILELGGDNITYQGIINGNTSNFHLFPAAFDNQSIPNIEIQNTNDLYIDVSRLSSVTFNGNSTTVTNENSGVIQHISLTKTDNAFVYGTEQIGRAHV
jgi:hypothetical protein